MMPQMPRAQTILNSLEEQMETGHLCDVLFYNNSGSIWAHSCILAGFSPFFSHLFSVHLENSKHWSLKQPMQINVSNITNCKSESKSNCIQCLSQIVKFIYTGSISPNVTHLQHLAILCNRLENEELIDVYEKFRRDRSLLKATKDREISTVEKDHLKIFTEPMSEVCQKPHEEQPFDSSELIQLEKNSLLDVNLSQKNSLLEADGCRICSFLSDDQELIDKHFQVFHSSVYKCLYCRFRHKNIALFINHIIENQCQLGPKNVVCSVCLFKGENSTSLLSHVKDHLSSKPFSCLTCKRAFERRSLWLKHTKSHIIRKSFQCSCCELQFNTDAECSKHFKSIHAPKKHVCDECGFCAPFPYVLEKHKSKHRKSALTCNEEGCNFRTSSEIMLLRHRSTHAPRKEEKVKSKECPVCRVKFTLRKNLIRHMRAHKFKNKKLKCDLCSYETFRSDKYNDHISSRHSDSTSNSRCPDKLPDTKNQLVDDRLKTARSESVSLGESNCNDGLSKRDASYNVGTHFPQKPNTLMMNDEGDISIVDTNEKNSVTLRNIGNLTGTITLNERTGVLTMSNINSGSVFLNETTGELTYINLENDKNIELNYFSSETMKHVDKVDRKMKPEVTKLDECTGEIIKVLPSNDDTNSPEQEYDSFDMDVNDESLDGFDDFDELLFDVFNGTEPDLECQVVFQKDQSVNELSSVMPHLDESTGLLTFDQSLAHQQEMWSGSFARHIKNSSKMNDETVYQLLLDEVTGVLHD